MTTKYLEKDQVSSLVIEAQQGCEHSIEKLFENYKRLLWKLAYKFKGGGYDVEDLFGVASESFVKSVRRFDPERGFAFTTFLVPTIEGELMRYKRDFPAKSSLKFSRELSESANKMQQNMRGWEDFNEEFNNSGVNKKFENIMVQRIKGDVRLDSVVQREEDETSPIANLVNSSNFSETEYKELTIDISRLLVGREKAIFKYRFIYGYPQRHVSKNLGISQAHVSRIEISIKKRLADYFGIDDQV